MKHPDLPKQIYNITPRMAAMLKVNPGPIIITDKSIVHVKEHHLNQLAGVLPYDYITYVFQNYTRIYKGSKQSLLFIVFDKKLAKLAAVSMDYSQTQWIVRSAYPVACKRLDKKILLYKKD